MRPLTRSLKCDRCDHYMFGYVVRAKGLHYYRCIQCNGVSLNVKTSPSRTGADDLFLELLNRYAIPDPYFALVELQLKKLFKYYQGEGGGNTEALKIQLTSLEAKKKSLKIRHALQEIDAESYQLATEHLNDQIATISVELNIAPQQISNLDKLLSESLKKLTKLATVWHSSNLDNRRVIQKTLFPDGIFYDAENHTYLTRNPNKFIELTRSISEACEGIKKATDQENLEKSLLVPEQGQLSNQILHDFLKLNRL